VTRIFNGNNVGERSFGDISYALRGRKLLFDRHARVSSGIRMVGPNYRTAGVADLRTDIFAYEIGYEHTLLRNILTIGTEYGVERSGFIVREPNTSTLTRASITADVRSRDMPAVTIGYSRNKQEQTTLIDSVPVGRVTRVEQFSVASRHMVRLRETRLGVFLSYGRQEGTSDDGLTDFTTTGIALSTRLSLPSPVSFGLTVSHSKTESSADTTRVPASVAADISALHTLFGVWQNVVGATYANNQLSRTRGGYFTTGLELRGVGRFEVRWEYTEFRSFNETAPVFVDRVLRLVTAVEL
jgi:hypothetical protein